MPDINFMERLRAKEMPQETGPVDFMARIREAAKAAPAVGPEGFETDPAKQGLYEMLPRGQIATLADTAGEANTIFQKYYPKGDVVRKDGELYYRKTADEKYRKIDPNMFTDPNRLKDLPYDIGEFVGEIAPTTSAELLAFGMAPQTTGAKAVALAAGAAGAGEGVKQLVKSATGTQQLTPKEQGGEITQEAMLGGTGELGGALIAKGVNAVRGAAVSALKPGAKSALQAQDRIAGLEPLSPGQVTANPIIARLEAQSRALSSDFLQYVDKQRAAFMSTLRKQGLQSSPAQAMDRLNSAVDNAERELKARWKSSNPGTIKTGQDLVLGFEKWDAAKRLQVDTAYDAARQAGPAKYDLTDLKGAAADVLSGRRGRDMAGEEVSLDPKLEAELKDVAQTIEALDPSMPPTMTTGPDGQPRQVDATEQMQALRSRLWDLKTPPAGEPMRFSNYRAAQLYDALSEAMYNPVTDDKNAAGLWKRAAELARERYAVRDQNVIAQIAKSSKTGGESKLANMVLQSGSESDVTLLKNILPPDRFNTVRDFAVGEVIRNPGKWQSMSPDLKGVLFTPQQAKTVDGILTDLAVLDSPGLKKLASQNLKARQAMVEWFDSATPAQVKILLNKAGSNPALRNDAQAAVVDMLMDAASRKAGRLDADAFEQAFQKAKDIGILNVFKVSERRALEGLRSYIKFAQAPTDVGTTLQQAEYVAALTKPGMILSSLHQIAMKVGLGRLMRWGPVRQALTGAGANPKALPALRALTAAVAANADNDMRDTTEE